MQVNVAGLRRNIKNLAHNYSDAQVKVREATSNDPWGPSATIMAEIAELTNNVVAFSEIMQMIWKRLNDHGKNWRHVYKALILLEYLIKTGNEKVSQQCKENIFAIQTLREFVYFEEGKDQGTHVREKAKQLVNLLKDDERLKNERIKALKAKERFAQYPSGFGSDGYIDGPTQRDMPPGWQEEPTKPVSELEMVRPQTAGEEELQLQLAMAMSREEAEQEEAKRRSDDVRLQLALSQSEQDFKHQKPPKEENQSHLMDLLDIQLGATSISSPPLGLAAGGLSNTTTGPWITPARAASQMSDPWTGTASPPVDPWLPATTSRSTPLAHMAMGAVGGMGDVMAMHSNGTNGADAWGSGMRTQSPSVTSGSSTEGWLQTNGNSQQAIGMAAAASAPAADAWSSKPNLPVGAAATISTVDAWLSDNNKPAAVVNPPKTLISDDPWAPKAGDPWKSIEGAKTKPSPDMDEFDIITNRNKSAGELLNINNSPAHASNNNANLLDDLDPLSLNNTTTSTGATAKKPLKNPQSFLGENSGLVNLDNLIKPAVPQTTSNAAAYNPFSDNVIPPKTNLFQQQQPAVPSINQLKQQSFQMTINQDPWAPVNNAAAAAQLTTNKPDEVDLFIVDLNTPNKDSKSNNKNNSYNNNKNNNKPYNSYGPFGSNTMKYSKSNYDGFRALVSNQTSYNGNFVNNSAKNFGNMSSNQNEPTSFLMDLDSDFLKTSNNLTSHLSYPSLYPHVEIINNNDTNTSLRSPPSSPVQSQNHEQAPTFNNTTFLQSYSTPPLSPQKDILSFDNNNIIFNPNNYNNNNNNNINNSNLNSSNNSYTPCYTSLGNVSNSNTAIEASAMSNSASTAYAVPNFSNAFQASLATTPGVTIIPLNQQLQQQEQYHAEASNLFSYGFYDKTSNQSFHTDTTQCKLENNNNMPWMKPEAVASNPFLS